jgi:hypothetical protein
MNKDNSNELILCDPLSCWDWIVTYAKYHVALVFEQFKRFQKLYNY